jgi:hypothetical protein
MSAEIVIVLCEPILVWENDRAENLCSQNLFISTREMAIPSWKTTELEICLAKMQVDTRIENLHRCHTLQGQ